MTETRISTYEAERWRQLSDELHGQGERLRAVAKTQGEWWAIDLIGQAERALFGAFAAIMLEAQRDGG